MDSASLRRRERCKLETDKTNKRETEIEIVVDCLHISAININNSRRLPPNTKTTTTTCVYSMSAADLGNPINLSTPLAVNTR